MTFTERNQIIQNLIADFQQIHDRYTSTSRILSDTEWDSYVNSMEAKLNPLKGTNLYEVAANLWMAFLNDTEYVQKELKKVNEKSRTNKTA